MSQFYCSEVDTGLWFLYDVEKIYFLEQVLCILTSHVLTCLDFLNPLYVVLVP